MNRCVCLGGIGGQKDMVGPWSCQAKVKGKGHLDKDGDKKSTELCHRMGQWAESEVPSM